jgi:hypothetical protein
MLYWIYILITVMLAALILRELFTEKQWRSQLALAIILIPMILRILQIK